MANEYAGAKEFREPGIPVLYVSATTPADAAFTTTPVNGSLVYCTADNKIYVRSAGTWRATAALA
jgi:hypothetical protein